jgi:uncharacterized protein YbjT (DUF2867 family)
MVGRYALGFFLERADVSSVTVVVRRPIGATDPKLTEVVHAEFQDFASVSDSFADQTAALYCLGAYTGSVPDEEFRRVTVDYTIAFAKALHARSPQAAVCFLSGQGADPSEKSGMAFARYKGAAEKALLEMGFPQVHIFRPGYIYPPVPRQEPNFGYRAMRAIYPFARHVYPNIGIAADDLARVMAGAALDGTPGHAEPVLENRDIRAMSVRGGQPK